MQIQKNNVHNLQKYKTTFGMRITPNFVEDVMKYAQKHSKEIEAEVQIKKLSEAIGDEFVLSKTITKDKTGRYKLFHTVHKEDAPEIKYHLSESGGNPNSKTWYTPEDENSFDMFMHHSPEQLQNMKQGIESGDAYILSQRDFN